jgi:phosphonate degradation associated HDIG domain protein
MHPTLDEICRLYQLKGNCPYGPEPVTQLEHALQCAALAEAANQPNEMIVACLLHDIGHLLHHFGEQAADRGLDDRHEYRAIPYLRSRFPVAVIEPIRLHVQAKRYLCAVDRTYWAALSDGSKQTLNLQGGIFSVDAAQAFMAQAYALQAVQLRQWDDQAKAIGLITPDLAHFVPAMAACALEVQDCC